MRINKNTFNFLFRLLAGGESPAKDGPSARSGKSGFREDVRFLKKFETDSDRRLRRFGAGTLLLTLFSGFYLTLYQIVIPAILDPEPPNEWATMVLTDVKDPREKPVVKKEPENTNSGKKKPDTNPDKNRKSEGRGDPDRPGSRARVDEIVSRSPSSAHRLFQQLDEKIKDMDRVLEKVDRLTSTGVTDTLGRRGKETETFNARHLDGDPNGTGLGSGIDDILERTRNIGANRVTVSPRGGIAPITGVSIEMNRSARRSTASILKTVRQHMPGLRHTYNKFLKTNPGFAGKVHIRFEIAPSGKVVSIRITSSSTGLPDFDEAVKERVRRWRFESIEGRGNDMVTIPFTFSE